MTALWAFWVLSETGALAAPSPQGPAEPLFFETDLDGHFLEVGLTLDEDVLYGASVVQ